MDNSVLQIDMSGFSEMLNQFVTSLITPITDFHTSFITDLALIMIIGAVVTLAFFKIKQPLIIGYLFAGMLLGPLSPLWSWIIPSGGESSDVLGGVGILSDVSALNLFSEIGVILLLFVIGIEFPYAKIKSIGKMAIGVGTIGLFVTLGAIFYAATSLGLNSMDSLFIAAALSISSTAVIVKILEEMGRIKRESTILVL
ncbi:MAG: cation:proton antiporter, partial [Nitrosarchaeum sp.]